MSIDEPPPTTRVFVSGLPPSFTSKDLRSFFGKKFNVTDAHVLPDRRIAFVGLADHESAMGATKHFNKSFVRMSKISVELARPVDIGRDKPRQATPLPQGANRESRSLKRKREGLGEGEVLRDQSRPKQEHESLLDTSNQEQKPRAKLATDASNVAPRKDHRSEEHDHTLSVSQEDTDLTNLPEPQPSAASDSDWLRGRTSRVLDLEEPDDKAWKASPDKEVGQDAETTAPNQDDAANASNEQATSDELQVPNGRLFFRNLNFDVTEDDLRTLLTPFGKVDEVSCSPVRSAQSFP